jgi:hypothetical protein
MSIHPKHQDLVALAHKHIKNNQQNEEGAHDYWHTYRVWKNAQLIAKSEVVNQTVVELADLNKTIELVNRYLPEWRKKLYEYVRES